VRRTGRPIDFFQGNMRAKVPLQEHGAAWLVQVLRAGKGNS
jgi:hypothetical protein